MVEPGPEPLGTLSPLSILQPRPPTPPRQSHRNDDKPGFISRLFYGEAQSHSERPSISNITPSSSAESLVHSPTTSTVSRKKVGWSNSTEYKDPPTIPFEGPVTPLSAGRKPLKSILKAHNGTQEQDYNGLGINAKLLPPHHHSTLATMLESIVQQLAGKDRSSKVDAYLMLSSSLKASENVPDLRALDSKMSLLLQFITRDLSEKNDMGKLDSILAINALVLLSSFLHRQAIRDSITSDFGVFIVDYSIRTFEDPQMSKEIVKHLMFVLAQQRFPSRIMNADRVGKLVAALHNIEAHIKGKSIVTGRLNIYRALLRQSRPQMITHTLWIDDLFTDMLSGVKEIRTAAITFGLESSYGLGGDSRASRAVSAFFQTRRGEGIKFADSYRDRLKQLLQKKQDLACVPQIWSVVILFLRGKPKQLEQWPFLLSYLEIVQACFNSSDPTTRIEANYAWNRFVFAVGLNEKTSVQVIRMLAKPLMMQLLRLRNKSSASRKAILGSSCNLLYYSLKPTSTPAQLDLFWDEYVLPLVGQSLVPANIIDNPDWARRDLLESGRIIHSLFDATTQRSWDESRAMTNLLRNGVDAVELPGLDPKWLRKNASRVFAVLAPIIEKLYWDLDSESEITAIWLTYITSIASPSAMEVKVSNDTMASIASIFGLLYKIWQTGPLNMQSLSPPEGFRSPAFLKCFSQLLAATIQGLGILPFTERQLCIGIQDTFIPVATPSHQPEKLKGEIRSPLYHLFSLFTTVSPGLEYDDRFFHMVHTILLPFFEVGTSSRTSRIDLARGLLQLIGKSNTQPCKIMWRVLADLTTTATDTRDDDNSSRGLDQPVGVEYRNIVRILEAGIIMSPQHPLPGWKTLFEASVASASLDAGDAGRAIILVEPLAKILMNTRTIFKNHHAGGPSYYHLLITKATYPKTSHALDTARKRLWGTGISGPKVSTFDPYAHLYSYIQKSLVEAYKLYNSHRLRECVDMVAATTALFRRCPIELRLGMLMAVQEGISPWIMDSKAFIKGGGGLSKEIPSLWDAICAFIPQVTMSEGTAKILLKLELLICSGLESTHKAIVSQTIHMWNSIFGQSKEHLEYPTQLKTALIRLDSVADILLPFFPESLPSYNDEVQDRQPVEFLDSQEDSNNFLPSHSMESMLKAHPTTLMGSSPLRHQLRETTPDVFKTAVRSSSRKRPREATPDIGKRKSRRRESTPPKLRHDDSQIQFQVVGSSPMIETNSESQVLTARQMEVKERQRIEAAMFPDLRSSPQINISAEPELPVHHSTRSNIQPSPLVEHAKQQTTPDPFLPSEDDSFIVSSPTPKRDSNQPPDPSAPFSSPQRLTPKKQRIAQVELGTGSDFEIPSSPPESLPGPDGEPQTSVGYPPALVDSYVAQDDGAQPAFGNSDLAIQHPLDENPALKRPTVVSPSRTPRGRRKLPALVPKTTFENTILEPIVANSSPSENGNPITSPKAIKKASLDASFKGPEIQRPATPPLREQQNTDATQKTPTSPQFVDAMSSPPSSDSVNDDVFEDAVSSPRLILQNTSANRASSPLSEFDESSMIRIMKDYDEGPVGTTAVIDDAKKSPGRQIRASSKKTSIQGPLLAQSPSRGSMRIAALKNATAVETSKNVDQSKKSNVTDELIQPQPSLAFIVPETPGSELPVSIDKIVVDGEVLNSEDTIIVDASALENQLRATMVGRPRKRGSFGVKKRKYEEPAKDESPTLDSQDTQSQTTPLKRTLPRKKPRGRPRKSSRLSQEVHGDTHSENNQNLESADVDVLMESLVDDSIVDAPVTGAEEPRADNKHATSDAIQTSSANDAEVLEAPGNHKTLQNASASTPREDSPAEVIEETILGVTIPEDDPITAAIEGNIPGEAAVKVVPEVSSILLLDQPENSPLDKEFSLPISIDYFAGQQTSGGAPSVASPTTSNQTPPPTFEGVKEKLQSLVKDLGLTAFSRNEVNDIEDIFMDAKAQLYDSAKRGRQAGDL